MARSRELEDRLEEWGKEYGGGRYEFLGGGCSPLASMIKWKGRAPQGLGQTPLNTAADEVQEAVRALERQPHGIVPAIVLACEYLTPGQPIDMKLRRLRQRGESVGRDRYYQHLRTARMHVAAWLRISYSGEDEEATSEKCVE
jgi:hypothetical protein